MKKFILLSFCLLYKPSFSQTNFNSSLKVNYGDGSIFGNYSDSEDDYNYSQVLFDINLFNGPWNLHSQFEFSNPPEIGNNFQGIRRFTFSYKKSNYNILFGDIYKSWGKGLVLNQYDDINIGYDNGIRGVSITYNIEKSLIEFISGNKNLKIYSNSSNFLRKPDRSTNNNILGLAIHKRSSNYGIGYYSLLNREKFPLNQFSSDSSLASHNLNSIYMELIGEYFDMSIEYANKYTEINPAIMQVEFDLTTFKSDTSYRKSSLGSGFAFSSNYFFNMFNISIDYSYYSFFVTDPAKRSSIPLPEGISQFQKPMLINQEHSSVLLNRLTHLQDNNDEIGINFSLSTNIGDSGIFTFNSTFSSRTKEWYRIQESELITGPWIIQKEGYVFPSMNPSSNPYQQHTFIIENFWENGNYQFNISKIYEVKTLYDNDLSQTDKKTRYDVLDALVIPFSLEYNLFSDLNILFNVAYQKIKRGAETDYRLAEDSYISIYQNTNGVEKPIQYTFATSVGFSKSSKWSFIINLEKDKYFEAAGNSRNLVINPLEKIFNPFFDSLDKMWISTEVTYRFQNNTRLSLFYGSNKGGVSCSNGVCRFYPGFSDGFRLQLTKMIY